MLTSITRGADNQRWQYVMHTWPGKLKSCCIGNIKEYQWPLTFSSPSTRIRALCNSTRPLALQTHPSALYTQVSHVETTCFAGCYRKGMPNQQLLVDTCLHVPSCWMHEMTTCLGTVAAHDLLAVHCNSIWNCPRGEELRCSWRMHTSLALFHGMCKPGMKMRTHQGTLGPAMPVGQPNTGHLQPALSVHHRKQKRTWQSKSCQYSISVLGAGTTQVHTEQTSGKTAWRQSPRLPVTLATAHNCCPSIVLACRPTRHGTGSCSPMKPCPHLEDQQTTL